MMTKREFGLILKITRKSRCLSQGEVCANVDFALTKMAYSKIERGISIPELDTLELITKGLGLEPDELYNEYFQLVEDKNVLFELGIRSIPFRGIEFRRKILNKIFKIIKSESEKTRNSSLILILFKLIISRVEFGLPVNEKMIEFVATRFRCLSKDQFLKLLEELHLLSMKIKKFEVIIELLKQVIQYLNYEPEILLNIWFRYGLAHFYSRNYDEAFKCSVKTLSYKQHADKDLLVKIYGVHGRICFEKRMYVQAVEYYQKCIDELNNDFTKMHVLGSYANIARTHFKLNDMTKAREYWNLVLTNVPYNHPIRLNIYTDLAYLEIQAGNIKLGEKLYNKCENILAKNTYEDKDWAEQLFHIRNAALLSLSKGKVEEAMKQLIYVLNQLKNAHLRDDAIDVLFLIIEILAKNEITLNDIQLRKILEIKNEFF